MAGVVKAKFFVQGLLRQAWSPTAVQVTLGVVSRGEENKDWAQATPSGQIVMQVNASGAAGWFADRLGKEIDVTFAESAPDAPGAPAPE